MRAAEMIADAENALRMLEECENEDDFRVLWIACITILRSVGHVLGKVDHENKCLAASIDSWWKNLKANKDEIIFHEFIETERNFSIKDMPSFLFFEVVVSTNQSPLLLHLYNLLLHKGHLSLVYKVL